LYSDQKAFIFSFVNKENKPFLVFSIGGYAIICNSSYGPTFGGYDIYISSDSNSNQTSHSNFGHTFKHADYQYGTGKAKSVLARDV
jgi:hypothetical protein